MLTLNDWNDIENYSTESLRSFIPYVKVSEVEDNIIVSGFRSDPFKKSIKKVFKTSRIYIGIFIDEGYRYVKFNKFYAIEFMYICKKLIDAGGAYCSVSDLKAIIGKMNKETWLASTMNDKASLNFNYGNMSKLTVSPLDHQMAALKNFERIVPQYGLRGSLFEMATGSGKTLLSMFFKEASETDIMIVLCLKPTVKQIWVDTAETRYKRPVKIWDSVDKGTITGKEDYIFCHYQAIDDVLDSYRRFKGKNVTIWIDESQKVTEEKAQVTQKLYKLVNLVNPKYVVHASATPLKARPTEAIPLLKTIDPMFTGDAVDSYVKVFGSSKAVALDMLNNRLGLVKFKVTKEQYSTIEETDIELKVDMPNKAKYTLSNVTSVMSERAREYAELYMEEKEDIVATYNMLHSKVMSSSTNRDKLVRYKAMSDEMHRRFNFHDHSEYLKECKEIEKEFHLVILEGEERRLFKTLAPMYKYPMLSIRGKLLGNVLGKMRQQCFSEMAVNMELERLVDSAIKKTVIFTSYVDTAKAAHGYCIDKGYDPIIVNQETNSQLPQMLKRAETIPEVNPVVATYQSLGTGNELVFCSTYIAIDVPFRDLYVVQSKGRINRVSQDTDVTYYTAVLDTGDEPNLSTRNLDILKWSKDQVDMMLGTDGNDITDEAQELAFKGLI